MIEIKDRNDSPVTSADQDSEQNLTDESISSTIDIDLQAIAESTMSTVSDFFTPDEPVDQQYSLQNQPEQSTDQTLERTLDQATDTDQDSSPEEELSTDQQETSTNNSPSLLQRAAGFITGTIDSVGSSVNNAVSGVKDFFEENCPTLYRWTTQAIEWARPLWEPVVNTVSSAFNKVVDSLRRYSQGYLEEYTENQDEDRGDLASSEGLALGSSTEKKTFGEWVSQLIESARKLPPVKAILFKSIFERLNEATEVLVADIESKQEEETEELETEQAQENLQTQRREAVEREIVENPDLELDEVVRNHLYDTVPRSSWDDNYATLARKIDLRRSQLEANNEEVRQNVGLEFEDDTELV